MRVGTGYDIHRLGGGRPFLLGGIRIESAQGPVAHSDGDVLVHAIIDAMLGATGLGDIGGHFAPSEPRWQGAAGSTLLDHTLGLVHEAGFQVYNLDSTVILEQPKLAPYIPQIRENLARLLGIAPGTVNVKAKTNEGLDALGQGRAVAAHAVVLLVEQEWAPT